MPRSLILSLMYCHIFKYPINDAFVLFAKPRVPVYVFMNSRASNNFVWLLILFHWRIGLCYSLYSREQCERIFPMQLTFMEMSQASQAFKLPLPFAPFSWRHSVHPKNLLPQCESETVVMTVSS